METIIQTIIVAIIGSAAFTEFTKAIINRVKEHREKKNGGTFEERIDTKLNTIIEGQQRDHRGLVRLQLVDLIRNQPGKEDDILNLAEEYFVDLKGNRYAVGIFKDWWEERHEKNDRGEFDYPDYLVSAYKEHYHKDIYED